MLKAILICGLLLNGSASNEYGRIGIRANGSGGIGHVYDHSPAHDAGLEEHDQIIEADWHRGGLIHSVCDWIDGDVGTTVHLKVKRKHFVFEVDVPRVSNDDVYDIIDTEVLGA